MVAKLGKTINIRKEYQDWMSQISSTIGDNISLSSYLDHIIEEHFNKYGKSITELLKAEAKKQTFKIR